MAAVFKKSIYDNSTVSDSILTKFGPLMQNDTLVTKIKSKSQPEIELNMAVGRPFYKTGSTYISAVDWNISSKFGMQIDSLVVTETEAGNRLPILSKSSFARSNSFVETQKGF